MIFLEFFGGYSGDGGSGLEFLELVAELFSQVSLDVFA
jgi:hypothetical protein